MEQPRLLLLGPPGSGKGTQCANITDKYDIAHITTGDALRANKDMETEYGTPRDFMERGDLVPDPVVNEIVAEATSDTEGFVLDGYPRNRSQAEYLDDITDLDGVFLLSVSRNELKERLTGRRVCPECGANYHVEFSPPETEGVCDECGSELIQREDDTEEIVENRLEEYNENTKPMIEFYEKRGELVEIDGEQAPDEVWHDLRLAIEEALE